MVAPFAASIVLLSLGWKSVVLIFSIPGFLVGVAFYLFQKKTFRYLVRLSSFKLLSKGLAEVLKNRAVLVVMIVEMVMAFRIGASDFSLPSPLESGINFNGFWGFIHDFLRSRCARVLLC